MASKAAASAVRTSTSESEFEKLLRRASKSTKTSPLRVVKVVQPIRKPPQAAN